MNKEERIKYFLESMMYVRENSQLPLTQKNIYSALTTFDINPDEKSINLNEKGLFKKWMNEFKSKKNIDVFVDPNWSYFCQFVNRESEVTNLNDHIKIYVPLDIQHIEHGAEKIFSFLEKYNIPHMSKIAKKIRFDDIVIRLTNKYDADLLANYIKNDKYIQEGLIKANPFATEKDGIAYASDGYISYNSTISLLISNYINLTYKNMKKPDIPSFKNYIIKFYQNVFVNGNYQLLNENTSDISESLINNYKRVIELIYNNLDPNFKYNDYINHYQKNMTNYDRPMELVEQNKNNKQDNLELLKKGLIEFGKKKNDDGSRAYTYEDAIDHIYEYIKTGNSLVITRSGNIRNEMVNCNYRKTLIEYMTNNHITFEELILETKKSIIEDATNSLKEKYGESYDVNYSIKRLLLLHDYNGFTSKNNSRENLKASVSENDIRKMIEKGLGIKISNYNKDGISMIVDAYFHENQSSFKK